MKELGEIEGRAIPYGAKNVDTDVIIPARWLKTVTREGLGAGAFETVRESPVTFSTIPNTLAHRS